MFKIYIRNILLCLGILGIISVIVVFNDSSVIAFADTYYDNDGYLTINIKNFPSNYPYWSPSSLPVTPNDFNIPSGYQLVGYSCDVGYSTPSSDYSGNCSWWYLPSSSVPYQLYLSDSTHIYISADSQFLRITNNISSSGSLSYSGYNYSSSLSMSRVMQIVSFVPVLDRNGNIVRPESSIIFDLNVMFTSDNFISFSAYTNNEVSAPVKYYLFPSSLTLSGSSGYNIISDTYLTELSASQYYDINVRGFKEYVDGIQTGYNYVADNVSIIDSIHFFKSFTSTRHSGSFNPSDYNLPYVLLAANGFSGSFSSGSGLFTYVTKMDLQRLTSQHDGVYAFNNLCILAVCEYEDRFFYSRYDFDVNDLLSSSVVPPSTIQQQSSYVSGTVTDLQEFADYLKYVMETSDVHRDIENRNMIAYLQSIPWTNLVAGGVYNGLNGFLPHLSSEFDTMFNGLFSDFFIPDLDEIEDKIDQDEAEFSDKFSWVTQIKTEVNFIVTTPLQSSGSYEYKIPIRKWGIEEDIVVFDTDWVPSTAKEFIKIVFDVFGTIALVFYIFKTLPSTLGNMPTD